MKRQSFPASFLREFLRRRSSRRLAIKPGNPVMKSVSLFDINSPEYNSHLNSRHRLMKGNNVNPHSTNSTRVRRTALAFALLLAAIFSITAQEKTECNVKVTLLQVNDVYQFLPVDRGNAGGLARVLTKKKEIQKENPNTLFLMAGDTI